MISTTPQVNGQATVLLPELVDHTEEEPTMPPAKKTTWEKVSPFLAFGIAVFSAFYTFAQSQGAMKAQFEATNQLIPMIKTLIENDTKKTDAFVKATEDTHNLVEAVINAMEEPEVRSTKQSRRFRLRGDANPDTRANSMWGALNFPIPPIKGKE